MLPQCLQRFPNITSELAQRLWEAHLYQGPYIYFVLSTVIKSIGILSYKYMCT